MKILNFKWDNLPLKIKSLVLTSWPNAYEFWDTISNEKRFKVLQRVFGSVSKKTIPKPLRRLVKRLEGNICAYCKTTKGPFEFDHIIPVSKGGKAQIDNIVVACRNCNRLKRNKLLNEISLSIRY